MRARFIRGENPLDNLNIGRVEERRILKVRDSLFLQFRNVIEEDFGLNPDLAEMRKIEGSHIVDFIIEFSYNDVRYYVSYSHENSKFHLGFEDAKEKALGEKGTKISGSNTFRTLDRDLENLDEVIQEILEKIKDYYELSQ